MTWHRCATVFALLVEVAHVLQYMFKQVNSMWGSGGKSNTVPHYQQALYSGESLRDQNHVLITKTCIADSGRILCHFSDMTQYPATHFTDCSL